HPLGRPDPACSEGGDRNVRLKPVARAGACSARPLTDAQFGPSPVLRCREAGGDASTCRIRSASFPTAGPGAPRGRGVTERFSPAPPPNRVVTDGNGRRGSPASCCDPTRHPGRADRLLTRLAPAGGFKTQGASEPLVEGSRRLLPDLIEGGAGHELHQRQTT